MNLEDPYWKLRPPPPHPLDEICGCPGAPPVVLSPALSCNPIRCADCNLEVPPERLGFSEELAEELAFWTTFHDAFYHLWLDSGEFESWAKSQLSDVASPVSVRGLELCRKLNEIRNCYYWWFQDTADDDFKPMVNCPRCAASLAERKNRLVCESCKILVAN